MEPLLSGKREMMETHTSRIDINRNVAGVERGYDVQLSEEGESGTKKNRAGQTAKP